MHPTLLNSTRTTVMPQEFLIEIHATQSVDFASMAVTLIDKATSPDEFTRMTAIKWLKVCKY